MAASAMYAATYKRLESYNVFDTKTLDVISRVAETQSQYETYQHFFTANKVPLEPTLFVTGDGKGVPLVDIPSREKTSRATLILHIPMGNSLDPNQLYQVATMAATFPDYRIIAFGNPSGKPYSYRSQNLRFLDRLAIAFTHKLRALVSAELEYLESQEIHHAYHAGYSYGVHKALILADYARPGDVDKLILVDPVAHSRYPQQLLHDFTATFKPLGEYVNRTKLQTYLDARQDAVKFVQYSRGIMRGINLAIGMMLSRVDFMQLLTKVLTKHNTLSACVAWGTKSELGNDAHLTTSLAELNRGQAKDRVRAVRLKGDTHAFANDVHLHAAIIYQALAA